MPDPFRKALPRFKVLSQRQGGETAPRKPVTLVDPSLRPLGIRWETAIRSRAALTGLTQETGACPQCANPMPHCNLALTPLFAQTDKACANTMGRSSRALNNKEKGYDLDDDDRHSGLGHMS